MVKCINLKFIPWAKVLIWTLGLISLSALTVRDFIPLLHDYNYNNVLTQVTVIKAHDIQIKRPNMTVFSPYYSGALFAIADKLHAAINSNSKIRNCEECDMMSNHSWDVWTDFN